MIQTLLTQASLENRNVVLHARSIVVHGADETLSRVLLQCMQKSLAVVENLGK